MKQVLVTGVAGFCGRHLCQFLIRKGYKVTGTYHKHLPVRQLQKSRVSFVPLEITDSAQVHSLIRRLKPERIFHLAAQSVPRFSWNSEEETFAANTGGTIYLLEALRRFAPHARLLFVSSIQVYGGMLRTGKSVRETDLLLPESPYAASKAVAEYGCLNFCRQFGLKVVIARPFNHLGTGQPVQFVFSDWCRQIALAERGKRRPVLEVGNLDAYRDFLHVQDVVEAYEILLSKGKTESVYNICSGRVRILQEFIDFLLRKARISMKIEVQKKRLRRSDPPVMRGNASRLRRLGWRPKRSSFTALDELLNEWRNKV